jgi:hypothetical protein
MHCDNAKLIRSRMIHALGVVRNCSPKRRSSVRTSSPTYTANAFTLKRCYLADPKFLRVERLSPHIISYGPINHDLPKIFGCATERSLRTDAPGRLEARPQNTIPVMLPQRLDKKSPEYQFSSPWAWLFPAHHTCRHPRTGAVVRYRMHEANVQRAVTGETQTRNCGSASRASTRVCHPLSGTGHQSSRHPASAWTQVAGNHYGLFARGEHERAQSPWNLCPCTHPLMPAVGRCRPTCARLPPKK